MIDANTNINDLVTGLEPDVPADNGYQNIFEEIRKNKGKAAKAVEDALVDAAKQDLVIINPILNNEEKIDEEWDRYNSYTKPFRRRADWITLKYFSLTNQQIYDYLKHEMYDRIYVKDAILTDGNCGTSEDPLNLAEATTDELYYVPDSSKVEDIDDMLDTIDNLDQKMEIGNQYMRDTGYIMLLPANIPNLDILEQYWDAYKTMVIRHQRMADWMTVELFGLTNEQIYIAMKQKFLSKGQDYKDDENDPNVELYTNENRLLEGYFDTIIKKDDVSNRELAQGLFNVSRTPDFYERTVNKKIITNALEDFGDLTVNVPSATWDFTDLPAYTPDEMIDMGVYSGGIDPEGEQPNDDMITGNVVMSEEWMKEYANYVASGIATSEFNEANLERIHKLEQLYLKPKKDDKSWRESVQSLGWNPDYNFDVKTRCLNDRLMQSIFETKYTNHYDFIDITDFQEMSIETIQEMDFSNSPFKPIFIILFNGKTAFSKLIRGVTHSQFSHAMLSLDSSFKKCYSFGMEGAKRKVGGFIVEDLTNKPKNSLCKIYTTFVSSEIYNTIKKNVEWFIENQKKTAYGFFNILTYFFHIPWQKNLNMICSQFTDRMLKLGNIDFTKRASSLLSPEDINKAASRNKKIFTIYKGFAEKINPSVINRRIQQVWSKGKVYESATLYPYKRLIESDQSSTMIYEQLLQPIDEIKELPIRISTKGDVLVNRFKKVDYEAEFAKSHKLLMAYDKENDIVGMKAELAHMWSYLLQIEEKLYGDKEVPSSTRSSLFKARAKIIGDFKKYMQVVIRNDPHFDFGKYYEASPYSNDTYKISGSTINGLLNIVKTIFL